MLHRQSGFPHNVDCTNKNNSKGLDDVTVQIVININIDHFHLPVVSLNVILMHEISLTI